MTRGYAFRSGGGAMVREQRDAGAAREAVAAAQLVAELLLLRGETVAVAESSAGGLVSATLIGIAGASAWFLGGVVPYGAGARRQWLGIGDVPDGAVSATMAACLAQAVRDRTGATWGVGESGLVTKQHGRRSQKAAGLCYVAVCGPGGTDVEDLSTGVDDRAANQTAFASAAISLLARTLSGVAEYVENQRQ